MNRKAKKIAPWLLLSCLSAIIWFAGPHFISQLSQPEKRIYLIFLLFLTWALIKILSTTTEKPAQVKLSELEKKIELLQGRFLGAMQFLKKTTINKQNSQVKLSSLPWYLLLGLPNAGKTSLLANANVNFILSKQFKNNIEPSESCDWWATRDCVLVDMPGSHLANQQDSHILFNTITKLIKKHCKKKTLTGIVLVINLPELMKKQIPANLFDDVKRCIDELQRIFGQQLSFQLVITKCDHLPGFTEFFSDHAQDELTQAWGITLPPIKKEEKLHNIFAHRFNALIKRINKQLLFRLHQEKNATAKSLIKDFPLQIERLKEAIVHFLKNISAPQRNIRLHGVYLTSALQPHTEKAIIPGQNQLIKITEIPANASRAHFIKQFILHGLLATYEHSAPNKEHPWQRRIIYAASFLAVLTAALILGKDFQSGVEKAYSIQNELAQYQLYLQRANPLDDHFAKALPLLNSLHQAAETTPNHLSSLANVLSFYAHKSQKTANTIYQQALQTIVLTEVKNHLEKALRDYVQNPALTNNTEIYRILTAYLMLGDTKLMRPEYVQYTIQERMPNKILADELNFHLTTALTKVWTPMKLDTDLITEARRQLMTLSALDLAYIILKNMGNNNVASTVNLGTDPQQTSVFVSKIIANQIPNMFTADALQKILSQEINTAATEATLGNWILGTRFPIPAQNMNSALAAEVRIVYLENYIDVWESLLANIELVHPKTLAEMNMMLGTLTGNHSPLLELLQTIQKNTNIPLILAESPKLQALNHLLENKNPAENNLYQIFSLLRQLHVELNAALTSPDSDKLIWQATVKHMQATSAPDTIRQLMTLTEQSSEPIKSWLNHLATDTWHLQMHTTSLYLDKIWRSNIGNLYETEIANHFPFTNVQAAKEANLAYFNAIFSGQTGLLTRYYQALLKPFIDESHKEWQWRVIDNEKLHFSNETLTKIQKAFSLQHAFFPNGDDKLFVPFSLQPAQLSPQVKKFTMTINGQTTSYRHDMPPIPHPLAWPGNHTTVSTQLNFVAQNNQTVDELINGDWGWFRLVQKSLQSVVDKNQLMLTFEVNGYKAKYHLFTQGHFNPFLADNLTHFELPTQLM